jgi:cytoskeletal protein RodZ
MANIGEILRHAREEKGRTLDDISAATNINKKFLQEIEQGNFPNLPETYIKAFIRSYALEVDLDPTRLVITPTSSSTLEKSVQPIPVSLPAVNPTVDATQVKSSKMKGNPTLVLLFVAGLAVIALVSIIVWMRNERAQKPVQEVSFSDVIREQESANRSDSQPIVIPDSSLTAGKDSLTLEGTTTESEWIRIVCDTLKAREYTLPPGARTAWRAKNYFILSVGNAKAISFKLNGKSVSLPSNLPVNLSNVRFSWNTLDTLSKKNVAAPRTAKDSLVKVKTNGKEVTAVSPNIKVKKTIGTDDKLKLLPKKP